MKASIKTFACSAAISIVLLACGDTNDTTENDPICNVTIIYMSSSSFYEWEKPVMYSGVKASRGYLGGIDGLGYSLGNFNGTIIGIITDKSALASAFPHIFSEQTECNYFAISFSYSSGNYDYWILSQDMVLHNIKPSRSEHCAIIASPTVDVMLVCDDTPEGNLKDRIDIDSIRSHADPNLRCSYIEDVIVDCK